MSIALTATANVVSPYEIRGRQLAVEKSYFSERWESWASDWNGIPLGDVHASYTDPGHGHYVLEVIEGLIEISVSDGRCRCTTRAETSKDCGLLMDKAKEIQPPVERSEGIVVPINYWSYTPNGAKQRRRDVEALVWDEILGNYTQSVREDLEQIIHEDYRPGAGGQLLLWSGPPGTGKTSAILALAYAWRDWCSMHYVSDPEKFFGTQADYMFDVLLGEENTDQWKLLILEDAGEFLQPDAKIETNGPTLSRFLNTVDGLIGRGLKILILVTTNEEVKTLHEAVSRPGRCSADVRFANLNSFEVEEWLEDHGVTDAEGGPQNLADLYALVTQSRLKREKAKMGFA